MNDKYTFDTIVADCRRIYGPEDCTQQLDYLLFAANCRQFLPKLPWADYQSLYLGVQLNRRKAAWDQLQPEKALDFADRKGLFERLNAYRAAPGMILTFHYGSFRLLPRLLCGMGYKLALLVARDVRVRQEALLREQASLMDAGGDIDFIDAEDPHCFRAMRRLQAEGYHILVYLDGNTGAQLEVDPAKAIRIPFLAIAIGLRKGLAACCHRWGWPVYMICPSTVWEEPLDFAVESLGAPRDCTPEHYSRLFYSRSYALLEKSIRRRPEGWEGWLYPHSLAHLAPPMVQSDSDAPNWLIYTNEKLFLKLDFQKYAWSYINKRQWYKLNRKLKTRFI